MSYPDYSNMNSIVGQGYQQDAAIRQNGIDSSTALTQHFIDAFTRAQETAYKRKMEEAQMAHQTAQDAINQQRADTYNNREQAYSLSNLLRQRNATQGELDKTYVGGNDSGLGAESDFYAKNNVPALNIPQSRTVGATSGTPNLPGTPDDPSIPGAFGMPDTPGAMGNLPTVGAPDDPGRQVYDTVAGRQVEKQYQMDQQNSTTNVRKDSNQKSLNTLRDAHSQQYAAITKDYTDGKIPLDTARARMAATDALFRGATDQSIINQRNASAANSSAGAAFTGARLDAEIPGLQADLLTEQANAAGSLSDLRDANKENIPILNAIRSKGNRPGGAIPPVSALKESIVTKFANGQKWTLQGGKPVQVP